MKIITLLILSMSTLLSCSNEKPFEQSFKAQKFDKEVIKRIELYDTLRLYLTHNINHIFKTPGQVEPQTAYYYYKDNIVANGMQIPDSIINVIKPVLSQIGYDYIFNVEIASDSTFTAYIRNQYISDFDLDVRERLIWRKNLDQLLIDKLIVKHKIINHNWDYRIWYDKRMGI
jgi:hypothetical protein